MSEGVHSIHSRTLTNTVSGDNNTGNALDTAVAVGSVSGVELIGISDCGYNLVSFADLSIKLFQALDQTNPILDLRLRRCSRETGG